jgi:hypothetical protein
VYTTTLLASSLLYQPTSLLDARVFMHSQPPPPSVPQNHFASRLRLKFFQELGWSFKASSVRLWVFERLPAICR